MPEPVFTLRGGRNCPNWRSRKTQAVVLGKLARKAAKRAVREEDIPPQFVRIDMDYVQGATEPQTSYAEVRVFDTRRFD